ncbi:ABC transporter permease [Clostridium thermarum]|uniref:ABC transporter permease n=1 Tax=Clostridium thermarum TaxID=1716543 RepID=UPI0013CF5214|nr:ABC transporter permease [Clostridium thermarum]
MGGFKPALINEIEKLYKKKKVTVSSVLSVIVIILVQLTMTVLQSRVGLRSVGSMEFPILVLSVTVISILPLFTALVTIDSFSGEFSHNTMKISLTRPVTRFKLLLAKICAIMCFVLTNLLLVMILSLLVGLIFNRNSFTLLGLYRVLISYIVTLLPMLVLSLMIIFFTNILKSGTGVFFLSIIVFIGFKVSEIVFYQYSGLFLTSMLDWYNLWIMDILPLGKIIRTFVLMCSYVIILFTGSYSLFDKRDF